MINLGFILESTPAIIKAIPITLLMAFSSAIIGWILGLGIALIRKANIAIVAQVCAVFVSFMRGVPMVILLYIAYYALPILIYNYGLSIGVEIDVNAVPPVIYAISALLLDQAAYSSEIFRSALSAVDEGQMEAAYSVGMTKTQALVRIIFPQAFAIAIPNLGGLFLGLVKGTSLAYYVGVYEITATANLLAMPALNFIESYIMTTIVYEVISFIINKLFRYSENRLKRFRAGMTV
ncbi:L-cystine transport system permease protein [Kineothrix alysoides]|uniref:L-cystine transport system permease protein n=1 Tax=Kineothrix alysoides TaxID=1469948 RepID=A0A4R1R5U8_9FIRM|nr:amino acid ABC transporter permease [Kineothrix alysoides]TCL60911.1 L-cystine transport system permease protein [Kineothrix alysoides]